MAPHSHCPTQFMESLKFANYTPLHVFNMTTEFQMPSTCFPYVFPSFVKTPNDKHQEYIYLLLLLIMALNVCLLCTWKFKSFMTIDPFDLHNKSMQILFYSSHQWGNQSLEKLSKIIKIKKPESSKDDIWVHQVWFETQPHHVILISLFINLYIN